MTADAVFRMADWAVCVWKREKKYTCNEICRLCYRSVYREERNLLYYCQKEAKDSEGQSERTALQRTARNE